MKRWKMQLSVRLLSLALALAVLWMLSAMPVEASAATGIYPAAFTTNAASPARYTVSAAASPEYYGRSALANCANATALLYAYDRLAKGVENGAASISMSNGTAQITTEDLKTAFDAYRRDYPEHFWIGNSYRYSYNPGTENVIDVMPSYIMSGSALEKAKTDFSAAVSDMVRGISGSMSEYDREKLLHDRLAEKVVYDGSAPYAHNAYGALVQGKAVCEGYAKAFQVVLRQLGIQSFIITGSSVNPSTGRPEGHAWNAVRIDGKYYHVDVTWDDQGENIFYAYFNKSTAVLQEDHAIEETVYALPVCSSEDADYFTLNGGRLPEFETNAVAELLKAGGGTARIYCTGDRAAFAAALVNENNIRALSDVLDYTGDIRCSYVTLGREIVYTLQGTGGVTAGSVTGTVKSFGSDTDTVTVQLFKSGSSAAAYSTTVKGNSASYTLSNVALGTYTVKVTKKNHVTREYTLTVTAGTNTQNAEIWLSGDVNADGIRDMTDVVQICRRFNGKASVFDNGNAATKAYRLKVADIYIDNSIDTTDFNQILRYYTGKSSALN